MTAKEELLRIVEAMSEDECVVVLEEMKATQAMQQEAESPSSAALA